MSRYRSMFILGGVLILTSLIIYIIHFLIFSDLKDLAFYTLMDLAFMPIQVLLVGIIIENIITEREKVEKLQKLNMVIGAYYSEVGRPLATILLDSTDSKCDIIDNLHIRADWKAVEYKKARYYADKSISTNFNNIDLDALKAFLVDRRTFLLSMVENPNVLEHERFTDLLLASFHLMEELESRPVLKDLPHNDSLHINVDIQRAFKFLALEWLDYMQHLKTNYPFLYSHYLRISPYQQKPSAIIE